MQKVWRQQRHGRRTNRARTSPVCPSRGPQKCSPSCSDISPCPEGLHSSAFGDKLSPNWNRSKALQPAVAEQLTEYGPWSSGPDGPTHYLSACPDHGRADTTLSSEGSKPVPPTQSTQASCQSFYLFRASCKVERARSSAPQLSRACNDIKQGDWMRWLGENHDLPRFTTLVETGLPLLSAWCFV